MLESRGSRKLRKDDVLEIRKMLELRIPCTVIAEKFGISRQSVSEIKNKRTWRGVK